jgi:hypothetical protein
MNNFIDALGDLVELELGTCGHGISLGVECPSCYDEENYEEVPPPAAKYAGVYLLRWPHPDWLKDGWWYYVRPENQEEATRRLDKCLDTIVPYIVRYLESRKISKEYLELVNNWDGFESVGGVKC